MTNERREIEQRAGSVPGLSDWRNYPPPHSFQEARQRPRGSGLCECVANPTHCFRTVSQRSLNVPTTFASNFVAVLGPGTDIFASLFASATGCLGVQASGGPGVIFNNANNQAQRQRINQLVLYAIRAEVVVELMDAEPVAAGSIDVSTVQRRLEDIAYSYLALKVYHTSDRNDPWIDNTSLGYFQRPRGDFLPIPPVKWIERDPAMEILISSPSFVAGVPNAPGAGTPPPFITPRNIEAQASVLIECLFAPDADVCPEIWAGVLCPPNEIGNTPEYEGQIVTARR